MLCSYWAAEMLTQLQTRLRDLVAAEPLLAGRPVLIEDKGNLTFELEAALQTQSLAVIVAPVSGQAKSGQTSIKAHSEEAFEVVIHRGLLDGEDVPSTVEVLDALIARLHGALLDAAAPKPGRRFAYAGHQLRENGDGSYARVLALSVDNLW